MTWVGYRVLAALSIKLGFEFWFELMHDTVIWNPIPASIAGLASVRVKSRCYLRFLSMCHPLVKLSEIAVNSSGVKFSVLISLLEHHLTNLTFWFARITIVLTHKYTTRNAYIHAHRWLFTYQKKLNDLNLCGSHFCLYKSKFCLRSLWLWQLEF